MRRSLDWEVHQAVIVHPPLLRLVGRAVAAILLELRTIGDRIAPATRTRALYPGGTTTVSASETGTP